MEKKNYKKNKTQKVLKKATNNKARRSQNWLQALIGFGNCRGC